MIAVLPPECSDHDLAAIAKELAERGWKSEASRGHEQVVLAVDGPASVAELSAALARHGEIDVFELATRRAYARRRLRRRLMHGLVAGLAGLIVLALGLPVIGYFRPPRVALVAPKVIQAAAADELAVNTAKTVRIGSDPALLIRLTGRRYFALSAVCTYMEECRLEWSTERLQIVCPCHGCVYDVYGNTVEGPPSIPLAAHRVEHFGGNVYVRRGD